MEPAAHAMRAASKTGKQRNYVYQHLPINGLKQQTTTSLKQVYKKCLPTRQDKRNFMNCFCLFFLIDTRLADVFDTSGFVTIWSKLNLRLQSAVDDTESSVRRLKRSHYR